MVHVQPGLEAAEQSINSAGVTDQNDDADEFSWISLLDYILYLICLRHYISPNVCSIVTQPCPRDIWSDWPEKAQRRGEQSEQNNGLVSKWQTVMTETFLLFYIFYLWSFCTHWAGILSKLLNLRWVYRYKRLIAVSYFHVASSKTTLALLSSDLTICCQNMEKARRPKWDLSNRWFHYEKADGCGRGWADKSAKHNQLLDFWSYI